MHALIIEDHPAISMVIEGMLLDLGYTSFDVADSVPGAIELAERRRPELITADDRLTHGTGMAAVRAICANQVIPVVFIAGNPDDIDIPDVVTLPKPFRVADLRAAVRMAVAKARTFA